MEKPSLNNNFCNKLQGTLWSWYGYIEFLCFFSGGMFD